MFQYSHSALELRGMCSLGEHRSVLGLLLNLRLADLWRAEPHARLVRHEVVEVAATAAVREGLAALRARVEGPAGEQRAARAHQRRLRAGTYQTQTLITQAGF